MKTIDITKINNILTNFGTFFNDTDNYRAQVVGSYALYLQDMCDISDVKDLDIVIYTSKRYHNDVLRFLDMFKDDSNYEGDYTSIPNSKRIKMKINNIDVCVFISWDDKYITVGSDGSHKFNNMGKLTYCKTYVKPAMDIIKVKSEMGRTKDIIFLNKTMKKIFK